MSNKTPCVKRCQLKNGICLGCKRTLEEIIEAGKKTNKKVIIAKVDLIEEFFSQSCVPHEVRLRLLLNKKGFKFIDDGKFSSCNNKKPIPLGTMTWYDDDKTGCRCFKQEI